jgi:hypothetical protein
MPIAAFNSSARQSTQPTLLNPPLPATAIAPDSTIKPPPLAASALNTPKAFSFSHNATCPAPPPNPTGQRALVGGTPHKRALVWPLFPYADPASPSPRTVPVSPAFGVSLLPASKPTSRFGGQPGDSGNAAVPSGSTGGLLLAWTGGGHALRSLAGAARELRSRIPLPAWAVGELHACMRAVLGAMAAPQHAERMDHTTLSSLPRSVPPIHPPPHPPNCDSQSGRPASTPLKPCAWGPGPSA